ncbi:hypothetical protein N657DRAFT_399119 [Parathielavia appendiculata]|uniref:Uncharacterized protein n=1 Tax=Parathielavia appendiculata TaxID=2587402 RepID=A0AAN6U3V1_9PEZI|nr:hypothetical protein N657DRAFT_399119 [Parathielavia appendiculata]
MRTSHHLLLALASWLTAVYGRDAPFSYNDALGLAETDRSVGIDLAARYPVPESQCDSWVGVEMIVMVEVTEVCPEGSTVIETLTECIETLTRSICATSATDLPCYPCVMGTPLSSDTATVTVTSRSSVTEATVTLTLQLCSTCTLTTYVGTVPGYTPGAPCHRCSPYGSSSSPAPPATSSSTSSEGSGAATSFAPTTTITLISTLTRTVSLASGCPTATSSPPPGNPGLPSSATASAGCSLGSGSSSSVTPTRMPSAATTTAAPSVATAGGVRNGAGYVVLVVGWVVVGCLLLLRG